MAALKSLFECLKSLLNYSSSSQRERESRSYIASAAAAVLKSYIAFALEKFENSLYLRFDKVSRYSLYKMLEF
jgi:hypothetical protein